jgi:NAD(P)-dependent dehydrogenase (short-subunit alcohol dehydrogenase family)
MHIDKELEMQIKDAVVLVTGANRGMGQAWVRCAIEAGARRVYACARDAGTIEAGERIVRLELDITRPAQVEHAALQCTDVTLVINNAGIARSGDLLSLDAGDLARQEMETNYLGTLALCRAMAPVLKSNGGGAIINVLSVLSWVTIPGAETYSASKAAAWSMTNGLREALRTQQTQVLGLHVGFMDTDMTRGVDGPKAAPAQVVRLALAALEAGHEECLADELSQQVKIGLSEEPGVYLGAPVEG